MRKYFLLTVSFLSFSFGFSQSQKIVMDDVDRFWIAFDSVKVQTNKEKKIDIMKRLYFDKGSEGLQAFIEERHASPEVLVDLIEKLPNYWETLRPRMTLLKLKKQELENQILNFKKVYPDLKDSKIYFLIGRINSGGTTQKDKVLIGTEIALGDKSVSTSDFEDNWLREIFDASDDNRLVALNIHEYVHTQQKLENENNTNLLGNAILEGACDFVAELVCGSYPTNYIPFYQKNELEIWSVFYNEMNGKAKSNWIGTGGNPLLPCSDLGYAVGYTICKYYYNNAKNKQQAIKEIIELDYENATVVADFLKKSGYERHLKSIGFTPNNKKSVEGFTQNKETVTFTFNLSNKIVGNGNNGSKIFTKEDLQNIKSINVAGDFNKWDYKNQEFKLRKTTSNSYQITIPKSKIGVKGYKGYFKFVIDEQYWIEPQFKTTNKGSADGNSTNLFLIVN